MRLVHFRSKHFLSSSMQLNNRSRVVIVVLKSSNEALNVAIIDLDF